MQKQMTEVQEEVKTLEATFEAASAVRVTARGDNLITRIEISPEAVDAQDLEGLEDLLLTAVNGALREVQETAREKLKNVTGGMDLSQLGL